MEIAVLNTLIGIFKSIITIIKSKGIFYFISIICFWGILLIVIMITFLFYAVIGVLIKTKRLLSG